MGEALFINIQLFIFMDLNAIHLHPSQWEDLYGRHLHQIGEENKESQVTSIKMQGNMEAGVLWCIYNGKEPFLNEKTSFFLHKILQACKLQPEKIGLVNLYENTHSIEELVHDLQPKLLILCGLPESINKPVTSSFYETTDWKNLKTMQIDSLEQIEQDPQLKTKLWNALRRLFNL